MDLSIINSLKRGWLEVGSTRMVLLEVRGGFYAMRDSLEMLVGPDVAERVLYEAGNAGGMSYAHSAVAAGTVPPGIDGFVECVRVYSEAGFGDFTVEALDRDSRYALITCRHSFESWAYREHGRATSRQVCDYSSGVLAGFMRALTGHHDLECIELQCSVHSSKQCLFEVRPIVGSSMRYRPLELWDVAMLARENARLRAEAENLSQQLLRQNANLTMLVELASTIIQSSDLKEVLRICLDTVARHYRADAAFLSLVDASGHNLVLSAHLDIPPEVATAFRSVPLTSHPFDIGLHHDNRVRLLDLRGDVRQPVPVLSAAGFRVAAVVSLSYRHRLVGIMALLWKGASGLADDDLAPLASVGNQIGIAVENARLVHSAAEVAITRERNRIARELHDSVNQILFSMILTLNSLAERLRDDPGWCTQVEAMQVLTGLRDMASKALREMRGMVAQLRPAGLDGERLGMALTRYAEWLRTQTGKSVDVVVSGISADTEFDLHVEDTLYRIAQEALANAVKHAEATRIVVALSKLRRCLKLEIRDNGRGFLLERVTTDGRLGPGLGLAIMRERAQLLGGRLIIRSKPGRGTVVTVEVPITGSSSGGY